MNKTKIKELEETAEKLMSEAKQVQAQINQLKEGSVIPQLKDIDRPFRSVTFCSTVEGCEAILALNQLREKWRATIKRFKNKQLEYIFDFEIMDEENDYNAQVFLCFQSEEIKNAFANDPKVKELVEIIQKGF